MEYTSYSQMAKFKKCPLNYKFSRIKKELPNTATENGQNRHEIMANHLLSDRSGELKGFGPRLSAFLKYTLPDVTGVEEKFEIDIFGYIFKGVIDAYSIQGDKAIIVDWKNHKSNFVDAEQLKLYALAIANKYPEVTYFACYFYFLIPDYKEPFEFTLEEINEFSGKLLDIAGEMEAAEERLEVYKNALLSEQLKKMSENDILIASGAYKCKPGQNCKSCNTVEKCPENKTFEIPTITNIEQAKELSQKLFAFEAFADAVKDRIKAYMLENSIDELPLNEENRYYISYSSPSLKSGKIKSDKPKAKKPIDAKITPTAEESSITEKSVVAENATGQLKPEFEITADEGGKIIDSDFPGLIGVQLDPEAVANIPDGATIPAENPDPLNATGRLFKEEKTPEEIKPKPKRHKESTEERIKRLSAMNSH